MIQPLVCFANSRWPFLASAFLRASAVDDLPPDYNKHERIRHKSFKAI